MLGMKIETCAALRAAKILGVALAATAILSLAACNTVEGVGKDVKSTGKGIEETAENAK